MSIAKEHNNMRAPFQILAIPYLEDEKLFMIFKRKDFGIWQFLSGGGEDEETPVQAMRREVYEESGLKRFSYIRLASMTTIPAEHLGGMKWKEIMIPEIAFVIIINKKTVGKISLSSEHVEYKLVSYKKAITMLKYDSNKSALWEFNQILNNKGSNNIKKNIDTIVKHYTS